ncbi:hypothetical protein BDR05DRAFT_920661 [Suillus weaverae]|nr:hypothetical protein BDR05DRAFT_920661 [Suillus weaverae]
MDPSEIRKKIRRFRILVIGRANAGKTTILQRFCNTRENPEIYNSAGKKIDPKVLMASTERGEHDIENEMVFRNNPGFVFHDYYLARTIMMGTLTNVPLLFNVRNSCVPVSSERPPARGISKQSLTCI